MNDRPPSAGLITIIKGLLKLFKKKLFGEIKTATKVAIFTPSRENEICVTTESFLLRLQ
jgi:hypothetical protein